MVIALVDPQGLLAENPLRFFLLKKGMERFEN
jgi:hypothetical protein